MHNERLIISVNNGRTLCRRARLPFLVLGISSFDCVLSALNGVLCTADLIRISFVFLFAETLHSANKGNSLARSNASLYGNKEELYDRLRRHAYQGGKKGIFNDHAPIKSIIPFILFSITYRCSFVFSPFSTSREEWQRNHQRK
jgi:hypothetical protein